MTTPNPQPSLPETRLPAQVVARAAAANGAAQPKVPPAEPVVAKPGAPVQDAAYWEARFRVTDGMLKKHAAESEGKYAAFEEQLRELRKQLDAKTVAAPIDLTAYYTPEEIEKYGADYLTTVLKGVEKRTKELARAELKPLEDEKALKAKARTDEAKKLKADFYDAVTEKKPNWRDIDTDPRWLDWLSKKGTDRLVRQVKLDALSAESDVEGVVGMFTEFETSIGAVHTPANPPQLPNSAAGSGDPPDNGAPRGDPLMNDPVTKAFVKDFYKSKALGRITDERAKQVEARINAAYEQGIVR